MFMLSEFHVIGAVTVGILEALNGPFAAFHVNQNSVLSDFVLTMFHCTYVLLCVFVGGICVCMYSM